MGRFFQHIDWHIVFSLLLIFCFGLSVLMTIDPSLFFQQFIFFIVGLVLLFLLSSVDAIIYTWSAPFLYGVGCVSLLLSFLGPSIRGATRWIIIGGQQLQPSELIKPLMLLGFAFFITRYPPKNLKYIFLHSVLFLIPFFLIFKQPDLGTGIIYFCFWLSMMIAGGLSLWIVGVGALCAGALVPFAWHFLADYQKMRITTFISPMVDPSGAGYNALQSMIAVGSGQVFGRGLGRGTQSHLRFLPERHTDFIFATLIEEFGFFGGILLLSGYAYLVVRILTPFLRKETDDMYTFVYGVGLMMMLVSQLLINAGMNMGILPVTGITLPLVSYGGSSLLSITVAFGIYIALIGQAKQRESVAKRLLS